MALSCLVFSCRVWSCLVLSCRAERVGRAERMGGPLPYSNRQRGLRHRVRGCLRRVAQYCKPPIGTAEAYGLSSCRCTSSQTSRGEGLTSSEKTGGGNGWSGMPRPKPMVGGTAVTDKTGVRPCKLDWMSSCGHPSWGVGQVQFDPGVPKENTTPGWGGEGGATTQPPNHPTTQPPSYTITQAPGDDWFHT